MKLKNYLFFLLILSFLSLSCGTKKVLSPFSRGDNTLGNYYIKKVDFPASATIEEKVEMASRVIPTTNQYKWQSLELTAFIHFGVNTFTGKEWGTGKESPSIFNPTSLDVDQWVRVLKDAGFKLIILTAKHHDGFCLWQTKTTSHSVASSPYKGGKGDIVKEFSDACKKYNIKGVQGYKPNSYKDSESYNASLGLNLKAQDLGSRDILKKVNSVYWYPSEADVSIRPGWFYHSYESPKGLDELIEVYYKSVGYNSVLLLNVPPDTKGKFDSRDITVLNQFGNYIKTTFANGLLKNVTNTWVNAKIGDSKEYSLKTPSAINVLLIQENIMKGQRVEKFSVEVYSSGQWKKITANNKEPNLTTIGYKRLLKFDTIQNAEKIRITLEEARTNANISQVNVYYSSK